MGTLTEAHRGPQRGRDTGRRLDPMQRPHQEKNPTERTLGASDAMPSGCTKSGCYHCAKRRIAKSAENPLMGDTHVWYTP